MAKAPEKKVYKELAVIATLLKYETEKSKVYHKVRIVEAPEEPKLRLDVRECLETERYTGFTARGISITLSQVDEIVQAMIEGRRKLVEITNKYEAKNTKKAKKGEKK